MCGPSQAMKNLNNTVQKFTSQVTSEAGTVFGNANTVFNNIMSTVQGIVAGGPSQMGITGAELTNLNANAEQAGATMTRNLRGAAIATSGNVATPAGGNIATTTNAEQTGAATTAQAKNQITQASAEIGRENYDAAVQAELNAPSVFGVANSFNVTAGSQQQKAEQSQQAMDTQSNWWKPALMSAASTVASQFGPVGKGIAQGINIVNQNYQQGQQSANQDFSSNPDTQGGWGDNSGQGS